MNKIVVFASGSGTNAANIIRYFSTGKNAKVVSVFVNNPEAAVIKRVTVLGTDVFLFDRDDLCVTGRVLEKLKELGTDLIVLAGFLWHIPDTITSQYRGQIVNIHPALLPEFGGRGMYGERVHKAVIEAGKKKSGITIHYVNEKYDEGDIIFRAECEVVAGDTPATLAARVHELEYKYYPFIIEKLLAGEKV
ncbi:MAG: phosphoribosylglycinamide formyltransferase [Bacteroidales bacterium]